MVPGPGGQLVPANCMINNQPAYHPDYPPHPAAYPVQAAVQSPYGAPVGAPVGLPGPVNGMGMDGTDEREAMEMDAAPAAARASLPEERPEAGSTGEDEGRQSGFTAVNG